ncbi:MAG: hypothetical protein H0U13_07255 [Gemmatimonadaceae bacterium]|nr:hypothetical protein [Gemmatimonadaceae bacterium]
MTTRAGFFPTSVTFRGGFRYATAEDLDAALAAIQALIDGEDEELAPDLELKKRACELRIRVDTTCARDQYLAYETLIETLASLAQDGEVVGEIDDTITSYGAGAVTSSNVDAASVAAKAIAIVAWIPLVARDAMFDLAAVLP